MACAATLASLFALLGDPAFPLDWRETTMDDGKPLVFTLREREGALHARFVKSGEGLWAEGPVAICAAIRLERRDARQLRAGTPGWSATFASHEAAPR